jgi:myosin heavy subunit
MCSCGGVIEAVRMCRESYPSRYSHQDFYGTFNCLCPGVQGGDIKQAVSGMLQQLKVEPSKFRLGKTMVLLKREVVDNMERMRAQLLGGRAMVLQNTVRRFIARQELVKKRDIRRKYMSCVKLQSICRRTITRAKYVRMVQAVRLQERKRREEEERKRREEEALRNATEAQKAAAAQQAVEEQVRIQKASTAQSSRAAVLQGLADGESEDDDAENEVVGYLEDDEKESKKENYQLEQPSKSRALTQQDDAPPVSPLCIRIQVCTRGRGRGGGWDAGLQDSRGQECECECLRTTFRTHACSLCDRPQVNGGRRRTRTHPHSFARAHAHTRFRAPKLT